ncbi:chlorophyll synthesis pathway protein BchC [Rhodobium gokarnense]|uniref:chlorophyll synthesis pathway protein BchC n=1 Tax=Rhodobium gokarnense TaxID=364296 RepID=UPI0022253D52|nr:chlorophyll synthesis pathway protein BchC [Rhodobium gokarnense]
MSTTAVVLSKPCTLELAEVTLSERQPSDIVVDILWSGISTGTEKLLYEGRMPSFPGMGYPLVPGYEAVGIVSDAPEGAGRKVGDMVFVPGARCYEGVNGLFGASASQVQVCSSRTYRVPDALGEQGVLLALAATAHHAIAIGGARAPELVIGHGVLGRLIARIIVALGHPAPVVWEANPQRRAGDHPYQVIAPDSDGNAGYRAILDASGDHEILDKVIPHLAQNGIITLAGFYHLPLSFVFPPAFMREAQFRIAAQFKPENVVEVLRLIDSGTLSLDGLITHRMAAADAPRAYEIAFGDPDCLKMVLNWRSVS